MADDLRRYDPSRADRAAGADQLIGRAEHVQALRTAVRELGRGAGRAIAIVGEPGIGKSALLAAAARLAAEAGVPVYVPARARIALAAADPVNRPSNEPRVILLDDLHSVRADDVARVEQLIQATASSPLVCLLAYRTRQLTSDLAAVLAQATSAGLLEVRALSALTPPEAAEMLGHRPDAEQVNRIALGYPLYLKAIGGTDKARAEAETAILGELAGLSPQARDILQAAAVLGTPCEAELLAEVAGQPGPVVDSSLDELSRRDLLRLDVRNQHFIPRHEVVSAVVYDRIEPSRRVSLHRRSAAALATRSAPIRRRAHHLARAGDAVGPDSALTLVAAARDALYAAPAIAGAYLQTALPSLEPGEPEHLYEAQMLLARARLMSGDAFEGRELLDALRSANLSPDHGIATLADSSRVERRLGRYSEAGAITRSALAALADSDSATAAALHTQLADDAYDRQDFAVLRQHAEIAADIARRHGDGVGQAVALALAALGYLFAGDLPAAEERTTSAAELIDASSDASLLTNLESPLQVGTTEGMLGRYADAERHLRRAAELSEQSGQTFIAERLLTVLANTQVRTGKLNRALALLDASALRAERVSAPAERAISAMLRAEILFWKNGSRHAREIEACAARALDLAEDSSAAWAVTVRCFHAEYVLLNSDPNRARLLMLEAAGGAELPGLTAWRKPRWCDVLAAASLLLRDRQSVEHWARIAESSVEQLPSPGRKAFALRARMRAELARGDIEAGARLADEAAAVFAAGGERIETARTLVAFASASLSAGRGHGVESRLTRAALLAEQCGSHQLLGFVSTLRGRLAELSADRLPDGAEALTAREREIANLISTGITNSQIAAKLFLSVRTVDAHTRQIYRKLGVANRATLTRRLLGERGHGL
jgi:DNA-binding CsgD family transcriptional regulator